MAGRLLFYLGRSGLSFPIRVAEELLQSACISAQLTQQFRFVFEFLLNSLGSIAFPVKQFLDQQDDGDITSPISSVLLFL